MQKLYPLSSLRHLCGKRRKSHIADGSNPDCGGYIDPPAETTVRFNTYLFGVDITIEYSVATPFQDALWVEDDDGE